MTFSGSFPALNIAASAAAEAMNLKVLIMASIGASSYGANNPEFTYVDMAEYLYKEEVFSFRPEYVSIGGANDTGRILLRMWEMKFLIEWFQWIKNYFEEDFTKNIELRKDIFKNTAKWKRF